MACGAEEATIANRARPKSGLEKDESIKLERTLQSSIHSYLPGLVCGWFIAYIEPNTKQSKAHCLSKKQASYNQASS